MEGLVHAHGARLQPAWNDPKLQGRRKAIQKRDIERLDRILGLLSSDHAGERAAAAQAAVAFIEKHQLSWRDVLEGRALGPKVAAAFQSKGYGIDYLEAAESRIRQLKAENERLEKHVSRLKTQLEAAKAAAKVEP